MTDMTPAAWLAQVDEPVVAPELPIVDPHHHLWNHQGRAGFQPVYLVDELLADTGSGHRVEKTVFIECDWSFRPDGPAHLRCVGETEFVAAAARESSTRGGAVISAIVATCDLALPSAQLAEVLDAHEAAGQGLFRGIRDRVASDPTGSARTSRTNEPQPGRLAIDAFRRGVAELGRRGHTFDAWLYHPQLPELADMARAVTGTTIVLDHIGAPLGVGAYSGKRADVLAQWRDSIGSVTACPNVVVKLGGIGMATYGMGWESRDRPATSDEICDAWGAEIRFLIEAFGAQRCMFESNFPVDKVSCSYRVLWNAFKKMTADLSADDRTALFSGTASRVYRV